MMGMKNILKIFVGMVVICCSALNVIKVAINENVKTARAAEIQNDDALKELPELFIKAVNPGYTIDGKSNVGEMIEIGRKNSDTLVSLAGIKISYTNSSGNASILAEFPEHSSMAGETFLLRYASSPDSELAAMMYSKTLAFSAGPLTIMRGDEVIDSVCWTGKDGCYKPFKSAEPTVLVRNLETNEFEHLSQYEPQYDAGSYKVEDVAMDEVEQKVSQCRGVVFSEILSYYETLKSEQFIELHNSKAEQVLLDGCQIKYKNKLYPLNGIIKADGYFVRWLEDFSLTKNPSSSNVIELVDTDGMVIDKLEYYNGQRKGASYAFVGYDEKGEEIWKVTYAPTPGEANNYQEYRTCEEGKVINEKTGNCVKITTIAEKVCGEGQFLNILTGRCKKITSDSSATECKEGYYRNPETGRCKKETNNDGADYALVPETYEEKSSFVAVWAIVGVAIVGVGVAIWEFRREILKLIYKVFR